MKINEPTPPYPLPAVQGPLTRGPRPDPTSEAAAGSTVPTAQPATGPAASQGGRTDRVEISEEARSRSAQLEGEKPASATPAAKPSVAEIRQRIRDGVYETDAVLDSIAHRILDRGDL
jgi:anti-sigma28 factor (negative regulator of flagellin synthesis)